MSSIVVDASVMLICVVDDVESDIVVSVKLVNVCSVFELSISVDVLGSVELLVSV